MRVNCNEGNKVEDDEEDNNCVYQASREKSKAIKVTMSVNGKDVEFLVDTGCPVTLMPDSVLPGLSLCMQV